MKLVDVATELLLVGGLLVAAVPWLLQGRPSETLLLAFALAPPLVLALLLGLREHRARGATH